MAADVMMGNDQDCQAWIARFREQPAGAGRAGRRGGRAGRRGAGRRRRGGATPDRERRGRVARRLHPLRQAGAVRERHEPARRRPGAGGGPRLGLRRARDLRAVPGRRERGRVREARHHLARRPSHGVQRSPRRRIATAVGWRRTGGWGATRGSWATSWWTCRRRASSTGRSCARRPTRTRSRSTRSCACTTSRSASPTWPTRPATWSGSSRRWSGLVAHRPRRATTTCWPRCSGRCGRATGPPRWPCTTAHDLARLARVPRPRAGRRVRRRLDHRGRASVRPGQRRGAGVAGAMNPQIRFGEDLMSRVSLRDDEPRRRGRADRAPSAACVDELIADLCTQADADPNDVLDADGGRQPDHASPAPGAGSHGAGRCAVRAGHGRGRAPPAVDLDLHANPGARVYLLPCIAGHVGADTAGVILSEAPYDQES